MFFTLYSIILILLILNDRGGRLVGTIDASIQFIVDLNPDEYPVSDMTKCDCEEAISINLTIYFAADVYTPGKFKIGANISNL